MLSRIMSLEVSECLKILILFLLTGNLVHIIRSTISKKIFYDKLLLTFAIYFGALIAEPVTASIKFNVKYGFGILDILYLGVLSYILIIAVIRNNIFFYFTMSWDDFYRAAKEVFRREEINIYYRTPTIYVENGEASISNSGNLSSKNATIVKIKGLNEIISTESFAKKMCEYSKIPRISRYNYLLLNIIITFILVVNTIY